ncbi:hypothetical protein CWR48_03255 [Oceanobacillus arenosus]|uniref:Uncharacterized protein n=1 Tax=Oceanobacillus arenosus TaxID=1229153 RepID=A0A3D8PZP1_9BACI|nr:hypothetical protein CWR48_03255 [Oceanobacillus arenosus]
MEMIRCPKCSRFFRKKDIVNLDICNTVIHATCVDEQWIYPIKDIGTYAGFVKKYAFLSVRSGDVNDIYN